MTDPVFKLPRTNAGVLPRDGSLKLIPQRSARRRVSDTQCKIKCTITYHAPDYTKHWDIFENTATRTAEYEITITLDAPGAARRTTNARRARIHDIEVTEVSPAADPGPREMSVTIAVGPPGGRKTDTLTITPRERERIFLTLEAKTGVELRGQLEWELAYRWMSAANKIHELMEWQYHCIYAPLKAGGRGRDRRTAIWLTPDWARRDRNPNAPVMVSNTGVYAPGGVCISFVKIFLVHWLNYQARGWGAGSNAEDDIVRAFRSVSIDHGRKTWPQLVELLGDRPSTDTRRVFFCFSGNHVWLVLPLGGAFPLEKKYIYGFGRAWEADNAPPGWFEDPVEPGWYMVQANGPWLTPVKRPPAQLSRSERQRLRRIAVRSWNPIFNGPNANSRAAFAERIVPGYRAHGDKLARPVPEGRSIPWDARYSATVTYNDIADNLEARLAEEGDRFAVFAGTPLTWFNQRVVSTARGRVRWASTLDGDRNEVFSAPNQTATFAVYEVRDVVDPETGWVDDNISNGNDVRPILWFQGPEHGLAREWQDPNA